MKLLLDRLRQFLCRHQPRRSGSHSAVGQCVKCGKIMFMPVVQ